MRFLGSLNSNSLVFKVLKCIYEMDSLLKFEPSWNVSTGISLDILIETVATNGNTAGIWIFFKFWNECLGLVAQQLA